MRDFYNTVRQILIENPATRDDDMLLYGAFMAKFLIIAPQETFYEVMSTAKIRNIPSYESITRARRRVQEKEPLLQGERRKQRMDEEAKYHEYYTDNKSRRNNT